MLPLRVMSFNLRRRKVSDGLRTWSERRSAAVKVVSKYRPDILGTQEGLEDQVEDLRRGLGGYGVLGEARLGGRSDEFNAIFYDEDRFRAVQSGNFWLSETPEVPGSRHWGNPVPRMATWARFEERASGTPFFHLNTHLDHLSPRARRRGAALIKSRIPEDETVIMTGDFNAIPRGGTYRFLARHFDDSLRAAHTPSEDRWNATFHSWTGRGLYRIDYIFTQGVEQVLSHRVARERFDGRLPSDHFPIVSDLALRIAS